ncbi:MAG: hypothetical protein K8R35_01775, partial [Bacteroidales bacterium]|nr:hypothetical protein [Bacteroidales bacterium]
MKKVIILLLLLLPLTVNGSISLLRDYLGQDSTTYSVTDTLTSDTMDSVNEIQPSLLSGGNVIDASASGGFNLITLLRGILGMVVIICEAGGDIEPAKLAFCTKICSKIISSQFCIVIINDDLKDDTKIPNANVHMEYGLMLGFHKYVIPFQREEEDLAFNVSGLDTVKYTKT